jgi:hypothetical protein
MPKQYVAANAIVEAPFNVHSYLPFSTEMLYTWVLLVGPDLAAQVLHALFGAVVAAVVFVYGARVGGAPRWGALAAALWVTVPSVAWNAGIAHNEMPMALAVTVAFLALASWYETRRTADLAWFALAYGLSLGAKHTTLVLAPVFALVVLWRLRTDPPEAQVRNAAVAVAVCALALVFPAAWYAQNLLRTGNPIFPYFWSAFPSHSPVWDADRVAVLEGYLRTTYGNATLAGQLRLPWDVSLLGREDVPRRFDGDLGPAFLLVAPFVAWLVVRRPAAVAVRWRVTGLLVALAFLTWASQSQQIRFLLPFVPAAIALAIVAATSRHLRPGVRRAIVAGLAATVAVDAGVLVAGVAAASPLRAAVGLEPRDVYLSRRLGYYGYYLLLEREMRPGDRVLLVDMRNDTYDLDAPALSDSVLEDYTVGKIVNAAAGPDDVYAAMRSLGVTYILSRDEILLDPRFTPFEDDAARDRWLAFLARHSKRRAGAGSFALYALEPNAQQPETESLR